MKKISLFIALVVGIVAFTPTQSFALFDIGVYGGYSFAGEIDTAGESPNPTGFSYGTVGHYNQSIFPFIRLGIGFYTQKMNLGYDLASEEVEYGRKIVGFDSYLQLDIPLIPLHPYVKFAVALWEEQTGDFEDADQGVFDTYTLGFGAAFTFFPFLQVFGEYRYDYYKQDIAVSYNSTTEKYDMDEESAVGHAFHLGVRVFF
jgi:hypothetical protein